MEKDNYFVDVLLPLPLKSALTYSLPSGLFMNPTVGQRVLVPLGKHKVYSGLIRRIHTHPPENCEVKEIIQILDEQPVVGENQFLLWEWTASYYMCTPGEVMSIALPSGFKLESETKVEINPEFAGDVSTLTAGEIKILTFLGNDKKFSIREIEQKLSLSKLTATVQSLVDKGLVIICEEVSEKYKPRLETYIFLSDIYAENEVRLRELFDELEKTSRTRKQLEAILSFMNLSYRHKKKSLQKKLIINSGVNKSALHTLIKKGIFNVTIREISRLDTVVSEKASELIELTEDQQKAFEEIHSQFESHLTVLLHGVTGSGKTEIYIKLIQEILKSGKQVLYLLPEIALTVQIIDRLRRYFGKKVGVYHSHFTDSERIETWNRVKKQGEDAFQIVIGARSSLFLPFRDLGLIIVDEEHDGSYKQYDPSPRYNARDLAIVMARNFNAKVLLGSATPSMETYYNVKQKKFGLVQLFHRYAGLDLPEVILVDLRKEHRNQQGWTPYSKVLINNIREALQKKEQLILFQNRRGFSVHLKCAVCGHVPICKHCDVALTYHKNENLLRCHYCGYTRQIPHRCPECGGFQLEMCGFGTEKIEEDLSFFFPDAKISRLDYDTTRKKNSYQKIISDFENREIDILVGTQMLTKGLDFDNVSTVCILNADNMLYYPDFRAYERAYQIFSQVSGRAGRKKGRGKVLIQTFNPEHPVFKWIISNDMDEMFRQISEERKRFLYPPFCRFIKLTIKHRDQAILDMAADSLVKLLKKFFPNNVIGPAYPPISRVKNYYLKDILLKIGKNQSIPKFKEVLLENIYAWKSDLKFHSVHLSIDVDPY